MIKKTTKNKKKVVNISSSSPKKKIRLVDIANQFNLAVSTVSRILNGSPENIKASRKTRKMVLDAAMELGYVTHKIPVKYHEGIRSIIVVSHHPGEIFYQKIISSIERNLRAKGYACYFNYTEGLSEQAGELIDIMEKRLISGCLIFQSEDEVFTEKNKIKLEKLKIPCVVIDHHPVPCPSFVSTVELDHEQAGYDIASHLLRLGHRHFAFIGVLNLSSCPERKKGIEKKLAEAGLKLEPKFIVDIDYIPQMQLSDVFSSWAAKEKNFPTAIITVHDLIGYAALNVLENIGFSVPKDISIASFDDRVEMIPWCLDNLKLSLTSIRQPIEEIGQEAGNELIARINHPQRKPKHVRLKGKLIIRDSTAKPNRF
ncbi:MAG: hypothetical protein DRI44_09910 [Chlamydiae bacterium]|nr:MAG: hypothetical protein DRI44_09910 [Chlamydiota bacterium]